MLLIIPVLLAGSEAAAVKACPMSLSFHLGSVPLSVEARQWGEDGGQACERACAHLR